MKRCLGDDPGKQTNTKGDHVGMASLAKNGCSTKKVLQARTKLRKKSPNGGSTSLMWVSWGHVCQQFLLAPLGEVRKSTNNPQNINVNFGKDRRVAKSQILKGSYC